MKGNHDEIALVLITVFPVFPLYNPPDHGFVSPAGKNRSVSKKAKMWPGNAGPSALVQNQESAG